MILGMYGTVRRCTSLFGDRGGGECVSGILAGQEKARGYNPLPHKFESLPLRHAPRNRHLSLTAASASWTGAGIRNDAARDEPMPYKQYEGGADSCGNETGSLVGAIPADRLTDKRREK